MVEEVAELRVGGVKLDRSLARENAKSYLSSQGGYSYPAYDAFDAGSGPWRLSDGDLLAPALLNVSVPIPAFYALVDVRGQARSLAWAGPAGLEARHAGPDEISLLGELFAVLDDGVFGVRGTTMAKIMHRKRPAFVPLYDTNVSRCYVGVPGAPIPPSRRRTWREFLQLLAEAMVEDLVRERVWLGEVAALAAGPVPVTPLRALDIIAWRAGMTADIPGDPDDHERADEELQL